MFFFFIFQIPNQTANIPSRLVFPSRFQLWRSRTSGICKHWRIAYRELDFAFQAQLLVGIRNCNNYSTLCSVYITNTEILRKERKKVIEFTSMPRPIHYTCCMLLIVVDPIRSISFCWFVSPFDRRLNW